MGGAQWVHEVDAESGDKYPHRSETLQLADALIDLQRIAFEERLNLKRNCQNNLVNGLGDASDAISSLVEATPSFVKSQAEWEETGWYELRTPFPVKEKAVDALIDTVVR